MVCCGGNFTIAITGMTFLTNHVSSLARSHAHTHTHTHTHTRTYTDHFMVVDPDYLSRVSSNKNNNRAHTSNDADAAKIRRTSVPVVFSESKDTVASARDVGMQARNSLPFTKQSKRRAMRDLKHKQLTTKKQNKGRSMFSMLMSVLKPSSKKRLVCVCVCVCLCVCVCVCVCVLLFF